MASDARLKESWGEGEERVHAKKLDTRRDNRSNAICAGEHPIMHAHTEWDEFHLSSHLRRSGKLCRTANAPQVCTPASTQNGNALTYHPIVHVKKEKSDIYIYWIFGIVSGLSTPANVIDCCFFLHLLATCKRRVPNVQTF